MIERIYAVLQLTGRPQGATIQQIAEELGVEYNSARRTINSMASLGLLSSEPGPSRVGEQSPGAAPRIYRWPPIVQLRERLEALGRSKNPVVDAGRLLAWVESGKIWEAAGGEIDPTTPDDQAHWWLRRLQEHLRLADELGATHVARILRRQVPHTTDERLADIFRELAGWLEGGS